MGDLMKLKYIKIDELKEGMRIGRTIYDRMDRVLIPQDIAIDHVGIDFLKKMGVSRVYIQEKEDIPVPEPKEAAIAPEVQQKIEESRIDDPAKVTLSESVKKRVSEGIQYLYSNTDSSEFADTTTKITSDLMRAINQNDALAVDISVLKTSDEYTFKHSVDVATLSMVNAKKQGLSEKDIYHIGIAGLLHDMGKSKIPNEILNKPGKLTDGEFAIMKQHPLLGFQILKNKPEFSGHISLAVLQHHEKANGRGYPRGVKGDQICFYAKILSVSDIYDALVTERPYKKSFSQRTAVEMLMSMTEELDLSSLQNFLASVILYPVDSEVKLSNGERARVVKNDSQTVLRPTVVGLTSGRVYDLANDLSCANIVIE